MDAVGDSQGPKTTRFQQSYPALSAFNYRQLIVGKKRPCRASQVAANGTNFLILVEAVTSEGRSMIRNAHARFLANKYGINDCRTEIQAP